MKLISHNCAREDESPERGHGVCLDSLQYSHAVFSVLGHDGLRPETGIDLLIFVVVNTRLLKLLGVSRLGLVVAIHIDVESSS